MMKIETTRFGTLEISDDSLLRFPSGLVGFPACRRFVVIDVGEDMEYQWLQSVDEPSLALIIMEMHLLQPDFRIEVPDEGLAELELAQADPIQTLVVVTIPAGQPDQATGNLRAPLIVNVRARKGKQLILHESLPLRYPLLQESSGSSSTRKSVTEPASV